MSLLVARIVDHRRRYILVHEEQERQREAEAHASYDRCPRKVLQTRPTELESVAVAEVLHCAVQQIIVRHSGHYITDSRDLCATDLLFQYIESRLHSD